jgi:hypothetical protein
MAEKFCRQIPIARIFGFASACCVALLSWQYSSSAEPIDGGSPACRLRREQSAMSAARAPQREASLSEQTGDRAGINAAFNFLDAQMDRFHKSTIIYSEPSFSAYYPSGKIGDVGDISIDSEFTGSSHSGRASLRIDYRPTVSSSQGWAGVYFLYPDGNWGQFRGRNLSGATKLSFWVCADHDMHAEFFLGGIKHPRFAYFDTLPKISTGVVVVSSTWQRHEIDLTGHDLSSVIAVSAWLRAESKMPGPARSCLMMSKLICPCSTNPASYRATFRVIALRGGFLTLPRSMIRPLCFWLFSLEDSQTISDVPILLRGHYWRHSTRIEPSTMGASATPTRAEN